MGSRSLESLEEASIAKAHQFFDFCRSFRAKSLRSARPAAQLAPQFERASKAFSDLLKKKDFD
jgi:hypothetical protein